MEMTTDRLSLRPAIRPKGVAPAEWQRTARLDTPDPDTWTLDDVIARQKEIRSWYEAEAAAVPGARNGVYWFNEFYVGVTEGVARELREKRYGSVGDEFIRRLDVEFFDRYRRALCGAGDSPAWGFLFKDCNQPGRHPLRWALEGIHAHIVGDLAPAVAKTLHDTGVRSKFPAPHSVEHQAYTRINDVLNGVAARTMSQPAFRRGVPGLVDTVLPGPVEQGLDVYVRVLRQDAWVQSQLLWELWDTPGRDEVVRNMGTYAAWYAREVTDLLPLQPHLDFETAGELTDAVLYRGRRHPGRRAGTQIDRLISRLLRQGK